MTISDQLPILPFSEKTIVVLVIDDDPMIREILSSSLRLYGVNTLEAIDMRAALECLNSVIPSAIILDRHMADSKKFGGVKCLRKHPHGADCLIIGLSGDDSRSSIASWLAEGIDVFVQKPMDLALIKRLIEDLKAGSKPQQRVFMTGPVSAPQVLSPEVAEQLNALGRRTGGDLYAELKKSFAEALEAHGKAIRKGLEKRDPEVVFAAAHALKGCAKALGALEMAGLCAEIENAAEAKDIDSIRRCIPRFDPMVKRLHDAGVVARGQ
jgi:response regulator RpfG family c-di-GMP phosphodiesterase